MDYELFQRINDLAGQSQFLDSVMLAITRYGPFLLVLPLLYLWFFRGAKGKKAALLALASMGLALLLAQIITIFYFRERPFAMHEVNLLIEKSPDSSFPSDHATFSFAIASMVWLQDRKAGWVSLALALLIGVSRVFVGTHYPLDILGGALLGAGSALLVWSLRKKLDPVTTFIIAIARKLKLA